MPWGKWIAIAAAFFGFLSFHFLYSDGWSFDGTWSKFKELKEKVWPSGENRVPFWWRAPFGYICAIISTICWIVSTLKE